MCVCLSVGFLVCFLSATRHLSTLRRCLRVAERAGTVAGGPSCAGKHACTATARASMPYNFSTKKSYPDAFQKQNRTRAHTVVYVTAEIFKNREKRKPTCHFPSSVNSLPSLGVFTLRIVLNRILHKSSLLAPIESRRTRRVTFTAEERLERRRDQDRRRHVERRARERHRPGGMWIACGLPKPMPRRRWKRRRQGGMWSACGLPKPVQLRWLKTRLLFH